MFYVQKYCQLFMHESNTFLFKNTLKNAIQTNEGEKRPKHPLPLGRRGSHLIPQTASRSTQPFFHNSPTRPTDRWDR